MYPLQPEVLYRPALIMMHMHELAINRVSACLRRFEQQLPYALQLFVGLEHRGIDGCVFESAAHVHQPQLAL